MPHLIFTSAAEPMPNTRPSAPGSLSYRPDIDGLRAVAVVPVVLYHFRVPGFGGGFVGVDVFFVISGFLITSLIFGEMRAGEFSILRFYERRVRRIFPALFTVVAATLAVGVVVFFPRDLLRLAESAIATALFASNFDFWLRSGYFDVGADLKPLLHTWSLAVEEQFYLVFPALLRLLHTRQRRSLLGLVAALAIVSFGLSLWAVAEHPSAAFYLAPYRTWELMLGAILALGEFPSPKSPLSADAWSLLGLAAIAWAVFSFTAATSFPGANALFPCLGAAALIYAGTTRGTIWRVLASRPLVFVGLISYSLYLWHWPIHVYSTYVSRAATDWTWTLALIALSVGLAILSWRFVEQPFRRREHFSRRTIFRYAGSVTAATLVLSALLFAFQGLPQRFPSGVQRILAEADDIEPRRHECFNQSAEDVATGRICTIGDPKARTPSFLLWGDSHGDALLPAVEAAAAHGGRKGLFVGHGRCPPLLHLSLTDEPTGRCAELNDAALKLALRTEIKEVILVARWAYYDQGVGYGPDANEVRHLIDLDPPATPDSSQHAGFARILERTVLTLLKAGKKVIIVAPVPEPGFDVPEALARDALYGAGERQTLAALDYRRRDTFVLTELARLHAKYGVPIIDPAALLCASDKCILQRDGRPLYADHHHLSVFGAMQVSALFTPAFANK
ncbi:MAG TPA: acyltransferase family protein [Rhizomicrobium sp.]|nr:acyltransferase family protein [Rhizomicrobium sp.]